METKPTTTNYYRLNYQCFGIKKRCRKAERHFFNLGYAPLDFNEDEIKDKVRAHIKENMKEVNPTAYVYLNYITVTQDGFFEQWQPFSDNNKTFDIASTND